MERHAAALPFVVAVDCITMPSACLLAVGCCQQQAFRRMEILQMDDTKSQVCCVRSSALCQMSRRMNTSLVVV